jgi:hypothetical protein
MGGFRLDELDLLDGNGIMLIVGLVDQPKHHTLRWVSASAPDP